MTNRVTQQKRAGKVRMTNTILSLTRNVIPYVKELRKLPLVKSTNACILMQQLDYWFTIKPDGFFKYLESCEGQPAYKKGDSWTEELGVSPDEFRTAFDQIGVRYKSKKEYDAAADKFAGKYYCSYYDKVRRQTFYFRNHALVDAELGRLLSPEYGNADSYSLAMPISRGGESQFIEAEEVYPDYTETTTETTSNITYKEREQPVYTGSRSQDDIGLVEGENLHRKSSPAYDEIIDGEPVFDDEPVVTLQPSSGRAAPLPEDFCLTEAMRAWARVDFKDVDVGLATMKFINVCREQGRKSKNWVATWQNYIISWANNERKKAPAHRPNMWEQRAEVLRQQQEEDLFADVTDDEPVDFVKLSERLFGKEEDLFAHITD